MSGKSWLWRGTVEAKKRESQLNPEGDVRSRRNAPLIKMGSDVGKGNVRGRKWLVYKPNRKKLSSDRKRKLNPWSGGGLFGKGSMSKILEES